MKTMKMNRAIRGGIAAVALAGASMGALATTANAADGATWDALAQCESGGNWGINTGNGFFGGLQFTQQSWNGVGMAGSPQNASRAQQIQAGERLLAMQGWGAWPACSAKLGLYGKAGAAPQAAVQAPAPQAAPAPVAPQTPAPSAAVQAPAPQAAPAPAAPQAPVVKGATTKYTIQAGDTLSKLAEKFNVKGGWKAIYDANRDSVIHQDLIITGQTLNIPAAR